MRRTCVVWLAAIAWFVAGSESTGQDKTPKLKPTNVESVNTASDEDDPRISSSGTVLLYASTKDKATTIFVAAKRKASDKAWSAGKAVEEFADKGDCRCPSLSADGKFPQHLYFSTNYDPSTKDKRGDNFDIYYFIKQGPRAEFGTMTAFQSVCTEVDETHPFVTADGKQLYFSRKDKDGWFVYVAEREQGAGFGKPTKVGLPVDFQHACVSGDGKTMFVQGPLEKDRVGLFRCTRAKVTDAWSKPEHLIALHDAEAARGDFSPSLSADGATLWFASDRAGGKGGLDLWTIAVKDLALKK